MNKYLSIQTRSSSKISFYQNSLNAIRLLAAFNVFFKHFMAHFAPSWYDITIFKIIAAIPNVPIFFSISGFLLYQSWLSCNQKEKGVCYYLVTKFLRLLPAIWISFLFSLIMLLFLNVIDYSFFIKKEFFVWVLTQLTFFQVYNPDFLREYGVGVLNGSLWTIAVIFQYYIFSVFLYRGLEYFKRKKHIKFYFILLLLLTFLMSALIGSFINGDSVFHKIIRVSILNHLFFFVLGMFFRYYFNSLICYINYKFFTMMAFFVFVFLAWSVSGSWLFYDFGYNLNSNINLIKSFFIISFLFIFAYLFPFFLNFTKRFNFSFGIFIWHMICINLFVEFYRDINSIYVFFICSAMVFILSYLQFKFVENRFYNFVFNKYFV